MWIACLALLTGLCLASACSSGEAYRFPLVVTSELPTDVGRIPMSVRIDFAELIGRQQLQGVLDPNSTCTG